MSYSRCANANLVTSLKCVCRRACEQHSSIWALRDSNSATPSLTRPRRSYQMLMRQTWLDEVPPPLRVAMIHIDDLSPAVAAA